MKDTIRDEEAVWHETSEDTAQSECNGLLCSSCKYKELFTSLSCLFAEGVEFMTKEQIYYVIKKEVKSLEP